jgi:hypothetical protein
MSKINQEETTLLQENRFKAVKSTVHKQKENIKYFLSLQNHPKKKPTHNSFKQIRSHHLLEKTVLVAI